MTFGVIAAFFSGVPIAEAALIGGSLLLLSRSINPHKLYAGIDGALLLMFAGLFIAVAGAEKVLLTPDLIAAVGRFHLENAWILSGMTAALSNLVSNVPAVLILKPFLVDIAGSRQGMADRGDEFHFRRESYLDRLCRQSHCRGTRQKGRSDNLIFLHICGSACR